MSFRSDRFNGSMRSLDAFVGSFDDPSKIAGLGHLVPVLRLIARNGNDRKESIWELARGR